LVYKAEVIFVCTAFENRRRSQGVALGLFKFIADYLPYFETNKYIFQYHSKKKFELIHKD
jgi:hypothetical protein